MVILKVIEQDDQGNFIRSGIGIATGETYLYIFEGEVDLEFFVPENFIAPFLNSSSHHFVIEKTLYNIP
jgi:hypothetical protein